MKTRRAGMWIVLACTAVPMSGCAQMRMAPSSPGASGADAMPAAGPMMARQAKASVETVANIPAGGQEAKSPGATLAAIADSQPDRYLIKNATVTIEAQDVQKATDRLVATVQAARGYVADMHESVDSLGEHANTIEVRVPFTGFDASMQEISGLGKVLDKQVTAQDVTEEFVDTQAKLRNLKRTELRLLDHLTRTGKLGDTLLVEKELNRVREEIEQHEGRIRFLAHRIAFSTITVTLKETPKQQAYVPAATYSPAREGSEAVRSLVAFSQVLLTWTIWLVVWAPVWGVALGGLWFLVRAVRRRPSPAAAPPVYASAIPPPAAPGTAGSPPATSTGQST